VRVSGGRKKQPPKAFFDGMNRMDRINIGVLEYWDKTRSGGVVEYWSNVRSKP
jgi:hypothetical protein